VPDGQHDTWEAVARAVHEDTGADAPVSARELAVMCGLRLEPAGRGHGSLQHGVIRYDVHARPVRQHGIIAHELAHYVLRLYGEPDPEPAARYTAGALLVPRAAYDRDLRETAWDLDQLRARHPNASAQVLAMRVAELRDAVITILDQGRVKHRARSYWMPPAPERLTSLERELADAALQTGEVQRSGELLAAYPLLEGSHRRVIVIAEARQLRLRF
jgi:IrrE N-terminal-like domain